MYFNVFLFSVRLQCWILGSRQYRTEGQFHQRRLS